MTAQNDMPPSTETPMDRIRQSRRPRRLIYGWTWVVALTVVLGTAIITRLLLRDRVPYLLGLYYATPWIVQAALCAGVALGLWRVRRRRLAAAALLVSAFLAALWLVQHTYINPAPTADEADEGSIRVLYWNISRPTAAGANRIWDTMDRHEADVIGLGELQELYNPAAWKARFPGYDIRLASGGTALLVRGRILSHRRFYVRPSSYINLFDVEVRARRMQVILVDAVASVVHDRRGPLLRVHELLRGRTAPAIALGDFNTPIDSIWFDEFRKDAVHAFEAAGRGLLATWPDPATVLAIDHIWVTPEWRPLHAEIVRHVPSDHALILAELAVPPAVAPPATRAP